MAIDTQPYAFHKASAILGLTSFDMNDFLDMIIKANDEQLEAMLIQIKKEIKKRGANGIQ